MGHLSLFVEHKFEKEAEVLRVRAWVGQAFLVTTVVMTCEYTEPGHPYVRWYTRTGAFVHPRGADGIPLDAAAWVTKEVPVFISEILDGTIDYSVQQEVA